MILTHAQVTKYKSVWDSGEFHIGEITCLVGKNEAGKTALLQSIYKINPIIKEDCEFDVTNDYPRATVSDYEEQVADGEIEPATVITTKFLLESGDTDAAEMIFGPKVFKDKKLTLSRRYPKSGNTSDVTRSYILLINENTGIEHLISNANLPPDLKADLVSKKADPEAILLALKAAEQTEEVTRITAIFKEIKSRGVSGYIYDNLVKPKIPVFLYFDEYFQMKGHENVEALLQRRSQNKLLPSDHPMLGLIGMAGIDIDTLSDVKRTQELVNKLEGAGNRLSRKVLQYWSQNRHVQMRFDLRPARPEDPEGMRAGSNIWSNIYDSRHMVSTNLGTRSKGFVWFFSFLAWYSRIQKEHKDKNVILLLDEPGLFLHGRAQEDLLRYFEEELKGKHQVIYSTHSPFMVDSTKFDRVRIVQDRGIDADTTLPPEEDGTRVITEVLEASSDSLFPLQGALGYEIYQTLFLGPNCLVVEGVSDLLYLQAVSGLLAKKGMESLNENWTITPVGGSDKVPTFAALLGGQKKLKIATLIDYQSKDAQTIENLYKQRILKKQNVLTYADFTLTKEADIEDMFGDDFFIELVNAEYAKDFEKKISPKDLTKKHPRILVKLEAHMGSKLNHYRPARYFAENSESLLKKIPGEALARFEEAFKRLNALL